MNYFFFPLMSVVLAKIIWILLFNLWEIFFYIHRIYASVLKYSIHFGDSECWITEFYAALVVHKLSTWESVYV